MERPPARAWINKSDGDNHAPGGYTVLVNAQEPDEARSGLCQDYYGGEYLQDVAEARLLDLGGSALLQAAHDEAAARVDRLYPWDGQGAEPEARVSEYIAVLWQWTEGH